MPRRLALAENPALQRRNKSLLLSTDAASSRTPRRLAHHRLVLGGLAC